MDARNIRSYVTYVFTSFMGRYLHHEHHMTWLPFPHKPSLGIVTSWVSYKPNNERLQFNQATLIAPSQ